MHWDRHAPAAPATLAGAPLATNHPTYVSSRRLRGQNDPIVLAPFVTATPLRQIRKISPLIRIECRPRRPDDVVYRAFGWSRAEAPNEVGRNKSRCTTLRHCAVGDVPLC